MSSPRGIFRSFNRDHRLLSRRLQELARPALARVERLSLDEIESAGVDGLARRLADECRIDGPRLLGMDKASVTSGAARPSPDGRTRVPTTRHHVAIQVEGDVDILAYWPDEMNPSATPVDVALGGEGSSDSEFDAAIHGHALALAQDMWFTGMREEGRDWALYTFIDLTDVERKDVAAGRRDLKAEFDSRRRAIEPIVDAIRAQTAAFFDHALPEELADMIEHRRQRLEQLEAVASSLTWPVGWKYDQPRLETVPESVAPRDVGDDSTDVVDVAVEFRRRLAPTTFADVQRTIRCWVDAVERYPAAFGPLPEDRLSDLLTATLNAALPGASREVYSRGGKADIFIKADVLAEGSGPAKVFICESKWWDGPVKADEALEQVLRYLEVKDTAAVVIFFINRRDGTAVRHAAEAAMSARAGFLGVTSGAVEGWPVLQFSVDGRDLRLCLAFVDLPPVKAGADGAAG